jgi:hypothetical protein
MSMVSANKQEMPKNNQNQSKHKSKTSDSVEVGNTDTANIFMKAGQVASILDGLSKKQQKDVLSIVSARYSLRVVPVGLQVGSNLPSVRKVSEGGNKVVKGGQRPPPKNPVNATPEMLALKKQLNECITSLKAMGENDDKNLILTQKTDILKRIHELKGSNV